MPEPVRGDQRYLPGLDGVRALAVAVVVAYHLQLGWAQGGLLGVAIFFTLSGYLITDILLGQWDKRGSLRLADFWLGRARRLLPALIVMLIAVAIWMTAANSVQLSALRGNVVAAALYVSNWWYIAEHASYYSRFAPPAPLDHLWSLAVEEQFYLIWPWLLLLGLYLVCRKRGAPAGAGVPHLSNRARSTLAIAALVIAAGSAWAMVALYHPGSDPTRVYEGTDTRAFGLLIGAALAMVWPTGRIRPPAAAARVLDGAGVAALIVIALMVWRTNQYSAFLFRGGLVVLSAATALVVAAVATPGSRLGRALGWLPLRWLGVRSYGIYLWHYPLIVLTAPALGGMSPGRAVAIIVGTVVIAAASWKFVEEPIRRGAALSRLPIWAQSRRFMPVLAGGGLCLAVVVSFAASLVPQPRRVASSSVGSAMQAPPAPGTGGGAAGGNPGAMGAGGAASAGEPALGTLRTSCRSVVHIGDSTSDGLVSANYLPNASQRITARYAQIGIVHQYMEISGGTSVVETLPGQINAYQVAKKLVSHGYRGCWVIALGTNDTADVAIGSTVSRVQRVKRMMSVIGNQPVLWINDRSLLTSGPYSEQNMQLWNQALLQEEPHYPNMRVYDWAAVVQNSWYISDGIHFTSQGYAQRARLIADALARAFPAPAQASTPASRHGPAADRH
jgi:peptidoglycan/LPS O-acetylase OafA/YrhL/lysophospholipase L1-like esterase